MAVDAGSRHPARAAPPARVLSAFGVPGVAVARLPGGQGETWRTTAAGAEVPSTAPLVLKPVHGRLEAVEVTWLSDALEDVADVQAGFRLASAVRSTDGRWVVDGWRANAWVAGQEGPAQRWPQLLAAAGAFHAALAHLPRPGFLDHRQHRWARADRAAWDERDLDLHPDVSALAARLRSLTSPPRGPCQLVHGDLSGNVLFADALPPAVIDVSPYWRPAAYAGAVVVADALLWWEQGPALLEAAGSSGAVDLVARAVVFRLVDHHEHLRESGQLSAAAAPGLLPYRRAAAVLEAAA